MLDHLVALGYLEKGQDVDGVFIDRARNLGQVYAATGRPDKAIEQYEQVLAKKPDEKGAKMAIASCRMDLGQLDDCESIVKEVLNDQADAPQASFHMGVISFRRGDVDAALEHLKQAEKYDARMPGLHVQIGNVYLRRQCWKDAERAFKTALSIDEDSAEAHDGLGVAYRWQKRPEEAVHEHMQSIALLHYRPQTHVHLGLALAESGQIDWAIQAFNVALEQNPNNPFPHRCLAELYDQAKKDSATAERHRNTAVVLAAKLRSRPDQPSPGNEPDA
jgi:tetratricopeptide (TPR) repeat protein